MRFRSAKARHDSLVLAWLCLLSVANVTRTTKIVGLAIGALVAKTYAGSHYPLQHEIASAAGLSVRQVGRLLKNLERANLIERRCLGEGQGWRRTIYRLRVRFA